MAPTWPLIRAAAADRSRAFRAYGNVSKNNLATLVVVLAVVSPSAASLLVLVLGLPMLVAIQREQSASRVERLALLPLSRHQRWLVAAAAAVTNPLAWLLLGLLLLGGMRVWPLLLALLVVASAGRAVFTWRRRGGQPRPRLPGWRPGLPGRYGGLLAGFIRPAFWTLDYHAAVLLSLAGIAYRLSEARPAPAAMAGMSLLVVATLSTYAQTLFADAGAEGFQRYRLLPLPGWKLLLLEDSAFLLVLLPLIGALAPVTGLAAAFGSLAAGHAGCVRQVRGQAPWHFRRGHSYGLSAVQGALLLALGGLTHRFGAPAALPGILLWAGSLAWYGCSLDHAKG